MTRYDLESKSKDLKGVLDNVEQLSQKVKSYNNLIALDASSTPDKTEALSIFDNILSAMKPFEYGPVLRNSRKPPRNGNGIFRQGILGG